MLMATAQHMHSLQNCLLWLNAIDVETLQGYGVYCRMEQEHLGCGAEKLKTYSYCARFTVADIAEQAVISSAPIVHTAAVSAQNLL